jgi:hypothetical protein
MHLTGRSICHSRDRRQRLRCRRASKRPRWRRAHFDSRSALRARNRMAGEGRHVPVWSDRALEPTAVSALRRAHFLSAVGWFRDSSPSLSRSLWAGLTRVPVTSIFRVSAKRRCRAAFPRARSGERGNDDCRRCGNGTAFPVWLVSDPRGRNGRMHRTRRRESDNPSHAHRHSWRQSVVERSGRP